MCSEIKLINFNPSSCINFNLSTYRPYSHKKENSLLRHSYCGNILHSGVYTCFCYPACSRPDQGCQVLVTEKCQTLFLKRNNFGFYYVSFYRFEKGQLLNKFSKISRPTDLTKAKFVIFGVEKPSLTILDQSPKL